MGVVIGLATGCRRGEVLGLQWKHIRLDDNPYIEVRQQLVKKHLGYEPPKAGSYRKISIDRDTAEALSKWKAEQAEYLRMTLEDRARRRKHRDELEMGAASRTGRKPRLYSFDLLQTEDTPVVCDSLGEPHNTDNYGAWFRRFCCSVGLGAMCDESGNPVVRRVNEHGFPVDDEGRPYSRSNKNPRPKLHYKGLKFHELRHTNISLLIGNGMDIKIVQQRAGHKKASTTIDIYAHAMPENDRRAADLIGDLLAV